MWVVAGIGGFYLAGVRTERVKPGVNLHAQQHFYPLKLGLFWVCIGFVLASIGFELGLYWV
jgi:hypothetical protein